jgi:putative transposase
VTTDEHQPPLAGLSEAARADALVRWSVLRPHLEDGVPLARATRALRCAPRSAG